LNDVDSYSRFFDLDAWYSSHAQFIITPKASASERNKGLDNIPDKFIPVFDATKSIRTHEINKNELGEYLKSSREKQNLSQKDIAKHFLSKTGGLTGCVWNWENGTNIPTPEEWFKLKEVLDLDSKYDKMITTFEEVQCIQTVQDTKFPQVRKMFKHNHHPTIKPIKLMSYLITMGSRENDIVLDPFCGSGTTLIAAHQLNRRWIGIELNTEYAEIARKRIESYLVQQKLI
jgi:DNA modification methylase